MKALLWIVLVMLGAGCATTPPPSAPVPAVTPAIEVPAEECPPDLEQLALRFTAYTRAWQGHQRQRPYPAEHTVAKMLAANHEALIRCLEAAYNQDQDEVRANSTLAPWLSPQNQVCGGPWEWPGRRVPDCQEKPQVRG